LVTAVVWLLVGTPDQAVVRVITVLVIACPHALGLALPFVVSIATERAARRGVLIKDRLAPQRMPTADAVVFHKNGTLPNGTPALSAVEDRAADEAGTTHAAGTSARAPRSKDRLLTLAAAAESESEHPLAKAIVAAARDS